jgi:hypothetical protein
LDGVTFPLVEGWVITNCSGVLALLACAVPPKANMMPAKARLAAITVATIQPVGLAAGVVVAVVEVRGVDMMMIFLSLRSGPSVPLTTTLRQ